MFEAGERNPKMKALAGVLKKSQKELFS